MPRTHALCNAHLLRKLLYVQELSGERWPARISELLLRANELREAAKHKNIILGDAHKTALRTFYDAILEEGERRHPARLNPTGKASRVKQSVATCCYACADTPTQCCCSWQILPCRSPQNLGECAIRMRKVKQKISGSFRTLLGAKNLSVIRSCLDTLHKQACSPSRNVPSLETLFSPPLLNSYTILLYLLSEFTEQLFSFHASLLREHLSFF